MNIYSSWLYTEVSLTNIKEIVKIKNNFPNLLTKEIKEIQKVINKLNVTILGLAQIATQANT